jgi:hypothetical protein
MFKKLLNAIIGDFPPKHAHLCHQCRTAYTVVGIFNPPLKYGQLEDLLYNFALLCPKPCGALRSKPTQPPVGFRLLKLFQESGINCHYCRIALLTMIQIVSVSTATNDNFIPTPQLVGETHLLMEKNLICDECSSAFLENHDDLMENLEKIVREEHQKHFSKVSH